MKKHLILGLSFGLAVASIIACKKKEDDPAPVTTNTLVRVDSSNVTLHNQLYLNADTAKRFYDVTLKSYVLNKNSHFDITYGTGTAPGNEYFIGAQADPSVRSLYPTMTSSDTTTFFYSTTSFNAFNFDTLKNRKAVYSAFGSPTTDAAAVNPKATRIRETTVVAGEVFGMKLKNGTYVLAKVKTAPTGTNTTASAIVLTLKW